MCQEAGKWACVTIKTHWLSIKCREESSSRDLTESFGFVPIYTLFGSDMVLFVCLLFHAFSSIQHCKGHLHLWLQPIIIYLIAKLSPSPSFSLGWVVLVPNNPGRPTGRPAGRRPSGIVLFINFQAKLRKQKLLVYMRRPQNSFWTPPRPQN